MRHPARPHTGWAEHHQSQPEGGDSLGLSEPWPWKKQWRPKGWGRAPRESAEGQPGSYDLERFTADQLCLTLAITCPGCLAPHLGRTSLACPLPCRGFTELPFHKLLFCLNPSVAFLWLATKNTHCALQVKSRHENKSLPVSHCPKLQK